MVERVARRARRARRALRMRRAARGVEERLVWVWGSPRSGSTWLLQILGEHEAVVPVNEPMLGWYLGPFLSDLPGFGAADLDSRSFSLRHAQARKRSQFFADEFADVWRPALARMMRARFAAHAARYPPANGRAESALIVVKEPNGSQSADMIMEALPRARFLFLLRDGRDVIDSELAAHRPGAWVTKEFPGAQGVPDEERLAFVAQSARKWLWRTEVVERAYEAHPGPKLLLRYEDLLADTETQLRALLAWLGVPMSDADVRSVIGKHAFERAPAEHRGSQGFFRAASPGLWRENLTQEEQAAMEAIVGPKVRALGYAP